MSNIEKIKPENLYMRVRYLIESIPNFDDIQSPSTNKWMGEIYAIVESLNDPIATGTLRLAMDAVYKHAGHKGVSISVRQNAEREIMAIIYRTCSILELRSPAEMQGSFIPAGSVFDALAIMSKILGEAKKDVFLIDPYMDEKALTNFAILIPEFVQIRLLAGESSQKASLNPAVKSWMQQYGNKRPLEVRLAPTRSTHDRLIIVDNLQVWILTQSLNAFASIAPASISLFQGDGDNLKIAAYEDIWLGAKTI